MPREWSPLQAILIVFPSFVQLRALSSQTHTKTDLTTISCRCVVIELSGHVNFYSKLQTPDLFTTPLSNTSRSKQVVFCIVSWVVNHIAHLCSLSLLCTMTCRFPAHQSWTWGHHLSHTWYQYNIGRTFSYTSWWQPRWSHTVYTGFECSTRHPKWVLIFIQSSWFLLKAFKALDPTTLEARYDKQCSTRRRLGWPASSLRASTSFFRNMISSFERM